LKMSIFFVHALFLTKNYTLLMKKIVVTTISLFASILILSNCQFGNQGIQIPVEPYEKLSQYQFFKGNLADLQPNDRVVPYDLNSPLFSDYAHKARFVWMPEGTSANYTTSEVLDFPIGTVLIKNFYYENDETDASKGRRIMETRLLVNRGAEWEAIGYIWNEEQTEAIHEVVGDIKEVAWTNTEGKPQNINYIIPNKNQCKSCHLNGKKQIPIGPKVRNLNKSFVYADGEMNQLAKWAAVGYLDLNLGIFKATVSAGAGTGGFTYSIVPAHPEESIMIYRMSSLNPGAMMPELGRSTVHTQGVELISNWIAQMEENPAIRQSATLR